VLGTWLLVALALCVVACSPVNRVVTVSPVHSDSIERCQRACAVVQRSGERLHHCESLSLHDVLDDRFGDARYIGMGSVRCDFK
jgi:hypothetical protein